MVKNLWLVFLLLIIPLDAKDKPVSDPCQAKLVIKAQKEGLKTLHFYQLPAYYWQARKCQAQHKNNLINRVEAAQLEKDFKQSSQLNGCTSSCVYLAVVSILYFYSSKALKE